MASDDLPERIHRYRVVRELGRGAMGRVYLAEDPHIDRKLAIKVLSPWVAESEHGADLRQRFLQEARVAGGLRHPNIVTVFDADTDPATDEPYLAMEWVEGRALGRILAEQAPLPVEQAVDIAAQVAAALDFAHCQDVIHRDIKPANLLIDDSGRAMVADFGIAKLKASATLTLTGHVVGSPHYMAPEQIRGETLDGRADLFALGAVLYECLTGQVAFSGDSIVSVSFKILEVDPRPPEIYNPAISPELRAVLDRALRKRREDRFQTCADFAASLREAVSATDAPVLLASGRTTIRDRPEARRRIWTAWRSGRRQALSAAAALLVALALLALWGRQTVYPSPTGRWAEAPARTDFGPSPAEVLPPDGIPPSGAVPEPESGSWTDLLPMGPRDLDVPPRAASRPAPQSSAPERAAPPPRPAVRETAPPPPTVPPPTLPAEPAGSAEAALPPARLEVLHQNRQPTAYIAVWVDGERQFSDRMEARNFFKRHFGRPFRRSLRLPRGQHTIEVHVSGVGRRRFEASQAIRASFAGNELRRLVVKLEKTSEDYELRLTWKETS